MTAACGKHEHFDQDCLLCQAADIVHHIRTWDRVLVARDGRMFEGNLVAVPPSGRFLN